MCPLVVESSISSSPLLLAVNDRQSQSHQLDSTSSTGNHVPPLSLQADIVHHKHTHIIIHTRTLLAWPTITENPFSKWWVMGAENNHSLLGFTWTKKAYSPSSTTMSPLKEKNLSWCWTSATMIAQGTSNYPNGIYTTARLYWITNLR